MTGRGHTEEKIPRARRQAEGGTRIGRKDGDSSAAGAARQLGSGMMRWTPARFINGLLERNPVTN